MKRLGPVAIIGAGISGLSCAQALRSTGVDVRVFESASVTGGRCATRLWQGHLVDVGVQYITAKSIDFKTELITRLRQFRPIISPMVEPNNQPVAPPSGHRYYVLQGNNYFAHILGLGIDIKLDSTVETVTLTPNGFNCRGETYRAVVSSLPAPQTASLFALARPAVEYDPCLVALLEYMGTTVGLSREYYGRILPEGSEPLVSSHCENHKVGRIVGNKTVFVVQASPGFSRQHADSPPEVYLPKLARHNEQLWHIPPGLLTASYGRFWNYGYPRRDTQIKVDLPPGAFCCGDSCANSTVEDVWTDGQRIAREVLCHLALVG